MTETPLPSVFLGWVKDEAARTGMTVQQVLDREKAKARDTSCMTEDCLLPDEAEEIVFSGAYCRDPLAIDEAALPEYLHEAAAHVRSCNFCRTLLDVMTPHAND